jgi:hypothetical protein
MAHLAQFDFKFRRRLGLGSPCGTLPERILVALEAKQIEATDSVCSVRGGLDAPLLQALRGWSSPQSLLVITGLQWLEFGWWAEELRMPLVTVGDLVRLMDLIDRRFETLDGSGPAQRLQ